METSTDRDIQKYFKGKLGGGGDYRKNIYIHVFSWYQKFYLPS